MNPKNLLFFHIEQLTQKIIKNKILELVTRLVMS